MKIALCGKLGSGKNAAYDIIKQYISDDMLEVKFADSIYEIHDIIQENTLFLRNTTTGSDSHILNLIDKLVEYKLQHGWHYLHLKSKELRELCQELSKNTLIVQQKHKNAYFLQQLGTEIGRSIKNTLWTDQFIKKIEGLDNICCTDVRCPDELEACKEQGFITIKLIRNMEFRKDYIAGRDPNHHSEIASDHLSNDNYDYVIENNGTLEEFKTKLLQIIEENI